MRTVSLKQQRGLCMTFAAGAMLLFGVGVAAAGGAGGTVASPPAVIKINDHVVGFYLGRGLSGPSGLEKIKGNWVNAGAWDLGAINYAVHKGDQAIMYDVSTLPSLGQWERNYMEKTFGIKRFTVVLSHWHLDHIAGLPAFEDSPIYALKLTSASMAKNKKQIESGSLWGPPAIPVVMPTDTVKDSLNLSVDGLKVQFRRFNIHSKDAFVMMIPSDKTLYPGDTLEDTVTYMVEPGDIPTHIKELKRLRALDVTRFYPNHGDPKVIKKGGYSKTFIDAVAEYDRNMLLRVREPGYLKLSIEAMNPKALKARAISIWEPYRVVHTNNLKLVHEYWRSRTVPKLTP